MVPHDGLNSSFNLFDHSTGKTSEFSTYEESFVLKARELDGVGQSSGGASATWGVGKLFTRNFLTKIGNFDQKS